MRALEPSLRTDDGVVGSAVNGLGFGDTDMGFSL